MKSRIALSKVGELHLEFIAILVVLALTLCVSGFGQPNKGQVPSPPGFAQPNPIGAWFGIARPCTPPESGGVPLGEDGQPIQDFLPDPAICALACNGEECAPNNFPLLQVTMIPTLLADGTVLADDFGELFDHHTSAMGKWEYAGRVVVDGKSLEKYQATFVWFAANEEGNQFNGSIRPRFVTFFDKDNPDLMRGYIQPFLYSYTEDDGTIGRVHLSADAPFPDPNPADPLPEGCTFSENPRGPHCLGTLHFNIQRIPAH
jgi:hypothetical protein